jgi:hypothetical protein
MNHAIKDVIECKYTVKTFQERGYDEEVPIIGFAVEDLETVIKSVVLACADKVSDEEERRDILSLAS